MALQTRPEPMNASPHHSKVKVSLTLGHSTSVAGQYVAGKMEIECRADRGLGIGIIMVELFGIEELTSRDHSATSTFMHTRRLFQGPGLPPSNAVHPFPSAGEPPLPRDYHQARRGISSFLFRFPIPSSAPSAISFGSGLAAVKYEIRASVGVAWKGDKRLVTDKKQIDVVECYEEDFTRVEPQGVIIGENGKIWIQGRVVGGFIVSGECACIELQVKNHSSKKNTGLNITLTRMLYLPGISHAKDPPLQISDTLTSVAFRGPEYIIPPGGEGVATLVVDVPKDARSVKGGTRDGGEEEYRTTDPLFEVRCIVGIKMIMGIGSKDISLDLPVTIVHPSAMPDLPDQEQYPPPSPHPNPYPYPAFTPNIATPHPEITFLDQTDSTYAIPISPRLQPFVHQGHVWFPPPFTHTPVPAHGPSILFPNQQYHLLASEQDPAYNYPPRPSSAGTFAVDQHMVFEQRHLLPLDIGVHHRAEPVQGKGERASRISQHLHSSSRNRSVSPQSHRFPLPASHSSSIAALSLTGCHGLLSPPINAPTSSSASIPIPSPVVHSPRPVVSPKQSFSVDRMTQHSVPKSMRVEELERIAEELKNEDLSSDIPKVSTESGSKTLPPPPVPSTKGNLQSPFRPPRPLVDVVLDPVEADKTPPTPTLTAITPFKQPRQDSGFERTESGLDALERRLLAEVGTRKFDLTEIRPHIGTVLPIGIPQPNQEIEPLLDSAISSLSLAEHDSDERTQRLGKSSVSGDDRDFYDRGRAQRLPPIPSSRSTTDRDEEPAVKPKRVKKKEWAKDGEAHRIRKLAKGRVAAWLGGIDPDAPPEIPPKPDISIDPDEPDQRAERPIAGVGFPSPRPPRDAPLEEVSSAPNPRSSGFVPIKTLQKASSVKRSGQEPIPTNAHAKKLKANPDRMKPLPTFLPTPVMPQTLKTDRAVSPPSSQGTSDNAKIETQQGRDPVSVPIVQEFSRVPAFIRPPQPNPESKYDIKSARGGRGGKVTAVAAIWANAATQNAESDKKPSISPKTRLVKPTSPAWPPKLVTPPLMGPATRVDSPRNPTRPVIKSLSVPAIVSSSHATPTLSSTASLARVIPTARNQRDHPVKLSPATLGSSPEQTSPLKASGVRSTGGEFAFGQARLRDLIKKYQGQAH